MNAASYVLGGLAIAGPAKPAIVSGDDSVMHGELAVRVARFAAALREAGLDPGDRVALLMRDHADHVAFYLAVIAAGGIAMTASTARRLMSSVAFLRLPGHSPSSPRASLRRRPRSRWRQVKGCFCASASSSRG